MFAIAISKPNGTFSYVRRSTPIAIDWASAVGFAKRFKTEEKARRSHDHARAKAMDGWPLVVQIAGAAAEPMQTLVARAGRPRADVT